MADITLHNDKVNSVTQVSNTFIDNYMTNANGEYVKIYLYLLRCMHSLDCNFSISEAADKFEHTEKDIQRALRYWEKMKLLRLEYDTEKKLSGIYFLDSTAHGHEVASIEEVPIPKPKSRNYTAEQILAFQEKDSIKELLFVTEHYLKRPLTPTDINTILYWYDELCFSADLIEYLIEYCIGKGHTSLRYMDKVALGWKEEHISTVEQAKLASTSFSKMHFSVMKAFGISGRNLISSEMAYINKWNNTYGFTQDIIAEACKRTISTTHRPSFEYADTILNNWNKNQVKHLSDIAKIDSTYQKEKSNTSVSVKSASSNKFNNFTQRTYDYDKLEQQLLNK